jgi:hypothetical protein
MAAVERKEHVRAELLEYGASVVLAETVVEYDGTAMRLIEVHREHVLGESVRPEAKLPDPVAPDLIRSGRAGVGERVVHLRAHP